MGQILNFLRSISVHFGSSFDIPGVEYVWDTGVRVGQKLVKCGKSGMLSDQISIHFDSSVIVLSQVEINNSYNKFCTQYPPKKTQELVLKKSSRKYPENNCSNVKRIYFCVFIIIELIKSSLLLQKPLI